MSTISQSLSQFLEPVAAQFNQLGVPEVVVHWGHPLMMGIVVVVMGSAAALAGWKARLASDPAESAKQREAHRKIAPLMFLFIAMGYTGGVLSLVMQHHSVLESPHFWTGTVAIGVLTLNSLLSLSGFWGDRKALRASHAYIGSIALLLLIVHGALGLQLGLSL
jgi:F0F1-type ATP synthase membrane subunit c/vacuolar-type H+-ATPase subunit K